MNSLRLFPAALVAAALNILPGTAVATAADAPVYVVTSRESFAGVAALAREAQDWTDSLGRQLVVGQLDADGVAALGRHVHEREHRCGGFFAFSSRQEAEAFIALGRSAEAITRPMGGYYTIDNPTTVGPWLDQVSAGNVYDTIAALSAFHTRHYETTDGRDAALWIRDRWQALAAPRSDMTVELFEGCGNCSTQPSVILTIAGHELADEIVVVGGHLDSINWDDWMDNPALRAPGADDDASGIATMTEIIRIAVASGWQPKRTIRFMGYAAEELGLYGSEAIASHYQSNGADVVGVLQLDMTNYRSGASYNLRIAADNSNAALVTYLGQLFDEYLLPRGLTRGSFNCGYGCSDHASWTDNGYPAAMLFEAGRPPVNSNDMADFPEVHTANDTLAYMGDSAAASVPFVQLGLAFIGELGKTHAIGSTNQPPVADFGFLAEGLDVQFTDASSDSDGSIVSRHWDFGDGTTSSEANPHKTFASIGVHQVALTVTDDGGLPATKIRDVRTDDTLFADGFER